MGDGRKEQIGRWGTEKEGSKERKKRRKNEEGNKERKN